MIDPSSSQSYLCESFHTANARILFQQWSRLLFRLKRGMIGIIQVNVRAPMLEPLTSIHRVPPTESTASPNCKKPNFPERRKGNNSTKRENAAAFDTKDVHHALIL
jgi:hypothetical protein